MTEFRQIVEENDIGWAAARDIARGDSDNDIEVIFLVQQPFMTKTFEPIAEHLDVENVYLPTKQEARDINSNIPEAPVDTIGDVDQNIWDIDPSVVVCNNYYVAQQNDFHDVYPMVMMHHGCTVADREEFDNDKIRPAYEHAEKYLAPGRVWAEEHIGPYVDTNYEVIGVPEADKFVNSDSPENKTALFAPTNTNWGKGCLNNVGVDLAEEFVGSDWNLLFRPHPHDAHRENENVVDEVLDIIEDEDNIVFDDDRTPVESILESDLLITDDSGLLTEWLHTGRPVIQITNIEGNRSVTRLGFQVGTAPSIGTVERVCEDGYPEWEEEMIEHQIDEFGIPMDGKASKRAAESIKEFVGVTPERISEWKKSIGNQNLTY